MATSSPVSDQTPTYTTIMLTQSRQLLSIAPTVAVVSSEGELPTSLTSMALPLISTTTEAGWIIIILFPLQNIHNLLSLIHFQYQISLRQILPPVCIIQLH